MATRNRRDLLVDTSVAVALLVSDHAHHATTVKAVAGRRLGIAGHAVFETFSVLTRLPAPARRRPKEIARLLAEGFPASRYLSASRAGELLATLGTHGVAGGSVYDALVAATALEHNLTLATRDRRALATYRALEVDLELIG